ncbi:hypothetical protein E4U42_006698, partial [Claviceps africana]
MSLSPSVSSFCSSTSSALSGTYMLARTDAASRSCFPASPLDSPLSSPRDTDTTDSDPAEQESPTPTIAYFPPPPSPSPSGLSVNT